VPATAADVLRQLKRLGTEQNAKISRRHGNGRALAGKKTPATA
jgi:hypothetical protein